MKALIFLKRVFLTFDNTYYIKGEVGVLENLYSDSSKRLAIKASNRSQRLPQATTYMTHNTYKNPQL